MNRQGKKLHLLRILYDHGKIESKESFQELIKKSGFLGTRAAFDHLTELEGSAVVRTKKQGTRTEYSCLIYRQMTKKQKKELINSLQLEHQTVYQNIRQIGKFKNRKLSKTDRVFIQELGITTAKKINTINIILNFIEADRFRWSDFEEEINDESHFFFSSQKRLVSALSGVDQGIADLVFLNQLI